MKGYSKAALLCLALALAACGHDDNTPAPTDDGGDTGGGPQQQSGPAMILATQGNQLMQFRAGAPGTILNEEPLTGYVGEGSAGAPSVIAMDFRATGVLYALMSDNRLYTVNPSNGAMTLVGPLAVGSSTIRAFSFDAARDRIRAIGTLGENYDLNPDGTLFSRDTDLAYASGDAHAGQTPDVEALALTGTNGSTTSAAYGIDNTQNTLVTIGTVDDNPPPDVGELHTVGALSAPVEHTNTPTPFDVESVANPAGYLSADDGTDSQLYRVNLATGETTALGAVGHQRHLSALTVIPGTSGLGQTQGGGGAVLGDELCTTPIQGAGATFAVGATPPLCLGCDVQNPGNLVDGNPDNFARFAYSASALLMGIDVTVTATAGTIYPASDIAGGVFAFPPNGAVEVTLAPDVTITTLLGGVVQESVTLGGDTIILDLGGAVLSGDKFFAGFTTTKPFDAVRVLPTDGVIGALTNLDMYRACAAAPGEGAFP